MAVKLPDEVLMKAAERAYHEIQGRPHYSWSAAVEVYDKVRANVETNTWSEQVVSSDVELAIEIAKNVIMAFIVEMHGSKRMTSSDINGRTLFAFHLENDDTEKEAEVDDDKR